MAESPPKLHTMVSRSACIQGVLKLKVKVKGHVICALFWILGMSYSVADGLVSFCTVFSFLCFNILLCVSVLPSGIIKIDWLKKISDPLADWHRSVVPHQLGTPRRLPGPRPTASARRRCRGRWSRRRCRIWAGTGTTAAFCQSIILAVLGVVIVKFVFGHVYITIILHKTTCCLNTNPTTAIIYQTDVVLPTGSVV